MATDPLYPSESVQVSPRHVKLSSVGKGENEITWYCLTCLEDLWNGVGFLQAEPSTKKNTPPSSESLGLTPASTDTGAQEVPTPTLTWSAKSGLGTPQPVKKKPKILLRVPPEPTSTIKVEPQSDLVDVDPAKPKNKRDPQRVLSFPRMILSTRKRRPTAKARDIQPPARSTSSAPLSKGNPSKQPTLAQSMSPNTKFEIPEYWCTCHQRKDNRGMVKCDGEFCLIGWYHLRCTGLANPPAEDGITHPRPIHYVPTYIC